MRPAQPTFAIDATLRRLARPQLGLVTVGQAASAGIDKWALARRRTAGALAPVFAEVLRLTTAPATPEQRILAAALAIPGSVIAATSSAAVHQLPVHAGVDHPIVSVLTGRSARTVGITVVRQSIDLPHGRWLSARLATPAAALLMLPRFVDDDVVERCLDDALVRRLVTVGSIARLVERLPPTAVSGRRHLLELLAERSSGIGHRSALEQKVARWLAMDQLTGWQGNLQVPVGNGRTVEVDFAWPADRVGLEVSPFFTHGSKAAQQRDVDRRRLLAANGWRIVEASDPDLESRQSFGQCLLGLQALLGASDAQSLRAG